MVLGFMVSAGYLLARKLHGNASWRETAQRKQGGQKRIFAPCPRLMLTEKNGGHAEFIIGRAFARPGGFSPAHRSRLRFARKRNLAAEPRQINPTGKSLLIFRNASQAPESKIFRLTRRANQCLSSARLTR